MESDLNFSSLMKQLREEHDYEITIAEEGDQALIFLAKIHFDHVISEISNY